MTTPLKLNTATDLCRLSELAAKAARKILEGASPEVRLCTLGDVLDAAHGLEAPWKELVREFFSLNAE